MSFELEVSIVVLSIVLALASAAILVMWAPHGALCTLALAAVLLVAFGVMNVWYAHWSAACPQCTVGSDDTRTTAWRAAALTVGVWLSMLLTALVAGGLVGRLLSALFGMTHTSTEEQP